MAKVYSELNDVRASGRLWRPSGLDGDGRLAEDLPERRTVQSGDHSGGAGPQRDEKLGPGQRGASCDQTETRKVRVIREDIIDFWCTYVMPN